MRQLRRHVVAGDIFGDSGVVVVWTSSSCIVTIVGCRMSRVTARTRRAITMKKPTSNAVLCWPCDKSDDGRSC